MFIQKPTKKQKLREVFLVIYDYYLTFGNSPFKIALIDAVYKSAKYFKFKASQGARKVPNEKNIPFIKGYITEEKFLKFFEEDYILEENLFIEKDETKERIDLTEIMEGKDFRSWVFGEDIGEIHVEENRIEYDIEVEEETDKKTSEVGNSNEGYSGSAIESSKTEENPIYLADILPDELSDEKEEIVYLENMETISSNEIQKEENLEGRLEDVTLSEEESLENVDNNLIGNFNMKKDYVENKKDIYTFSTQTVETEDNKISEDREKLLGCEKCNYTGFIRTKTGLTLRCSCYLPSVEKSKEVLRASAYLSDTDKVYSGDPEKVLVPKHRQRDAFTVEFIKSRILDNLPNKTKGIRYVICNGENYFALMNRIIDKMHNMNLFNSYIIGAPNGFGKETFANTLIRIGNKRGSKMVPYISVSTLGKLYESEKNASITYLTFGKKKPEVLKKDGYCWNDYVDADVAIVYLTAPMAKEYESQVLNLLMKHRASENKPTIVMLEHSIEVYKMTDDLFMRFWIDMLFKQGVSNTQDCERVERMCGVDRLIHFSTYYLKEKE